MNNEQIPQELLKQWEDDFSCYETWKDMDSLKWYLQGRKDQYLSQPSQPKGAEEVLDKFFVFITMSARQYPKVTLPEELKPKLVAALQSYASQQLFEKDKAELKKSQQPEVGEDWKNKFREFCASHEGNKSGDLRVMHVEAVINWIERNQLFEPQPVQGKSDEFLYEEIQ
jgi:hypothetical protein